MVTLKKKEEKVGNTWWPVDGERHLASHRALGSRAARAAGCESFSRPSMWVPGGCHELQSHEDPEQFTFPGRRPRQKWKKEQPSLSSPKADNKPERWGRVFCTDLTFCHHIWKIAKGQDLGEWVEEFLSKDFSYLISKKKCRFLLLVVEETSNDWFYAFKYITRCHGE